MRVCVPKQIDPGLLRRLAETRDYYPMRNQNLFTFTSAATHRPSLHVASLPLLLPQQRAEQHSTGEKSFASSQKSYTPEPSTTQKIITLVNNSSHLLHLSQLPIPIPQPIWRSYPTSTTSRTTRRTCKTRACPRSNTQQSSSTGDKYQSPKTRRNT